MAGPVKAYNFAQSDSAAVVGAARSRIRQIVIYAAAAGAFTIKNGSASGETLISQTSLKSNILTVPPSRE